MPREHTPITAVAGLLLALVLGLSAASEADPTQGPPPDDLLEQLTGQWVLRGSMGQTRLHQQVEAEWVVQGHYLRMHMIDAEPPSGEETPYEAVYMLGYDEGAEEYRWEMTLEQQDDDGNWTRFATKTLIRP